MAEATLEQLADRVASHVKAGTASEYVRSCAAEAQELVKVHIGSVNSVPQAVLERAIVETAAELFWRRNAQNGIATFSSGDTLETARIGSDPMRPARTILAPWLGAPLA